MKRISACKSILAASIVLALSGCANNAIEDFGKVKKNTFDKSVEEGLKNAKGIWGSQYQPVTYSLRTQELFAKKEKFAPNILTGKKLNGLSLNAGSTLQDLSSTLGDLHGINFLFESDGALGNVPFSVPNFEGNLADLIKLIEEIHNISINYVSGNTFIVEEGSRFILSVPPNKNVAETLTRDLTGIGAEDIVVNQLSGSMTYVASSKEQRDIETYINRFYGNFASVRMQITVFSVSLDESFAEGFDWSSISLVLGNVSAAILNAEGGVLGAIANAGNTDSTQTSSSTTNSSSDSTNSSSDSGSSNSFGSGYDQNAQMDGSSLSDINTYTQLSNGKIGLGAFSSTLALDATIDWLDQYGTTRTDQSFFIETHTGEEAQVESKRTIPFNKSPSSNIVAGATSIISNSSETDEKEIGVTLSAIPYFDASSSEVHMAMDVELSTLIGFTEVDLGDGNTIRQPSVQTQKFPTNIRMKAGESKIFGGIIFDSIIEESNNPYFLDDYADSTGYKTTSTSKSALFVLLRPTVVLFSSEVDQAKSK
mgnify:CR=1 FL=1|tara:strand:+ start:12230 stop:13843 length:1614 start_codon:yes stop_codon:yes gene_type:complete